ncbi:LOW QUALITY PROTEIN: calpain-1 catalytic subunit-like [Anableps anableps]
MTSTCVKMIHSLYESGGEGSPSQPLKFKDQDYKQLKEALLNKGQLFQDEEFPANLDSLGKLEDITVEQLKEVEWLRPCDLHSDAAFIVAGASRFDFKQGDVGNCWFLSSIGSLTLRKSLMVEVVPLDQNFKDGYAGIFHFKFWRFGKWVDVVVDDLLPTRGRVPVSVSSRSGREFWAPLLEKAYAKVCGSYGDMIAGNPPEAFKDFSGGVHMNYELSKSQPDLDVMDALQCNAMLGCGTFTGAKGNEFFKRFGLVDGHAFAVTGVKQVESQGKKVNLVRIWNPWGEKEWNGDWSRHYGALMKMEDFCVYYEEMDICCESPNFLDGDKGSQWSCSLREGRWEAEESAGGSDNETKGIWTKPQYRVTLKETNGGINVLLSLLQKTDEEHHSKVKYQAVGFTIYKVPPEAPAGQLPSSFFQDASPISVSKFEATRELIEPHMLEAGEYLIIPCTYESNKTASFIITSYSKEAAEMI